MSRLIQHAFPAQLPSVLEIARKVNQSFWSCESQKNVSKSSVKINQKREKGFHVTGYFFIVNYFKNVQEVTPRIWGLSAWGLWQVCLSLLTRNAIALNATLFLKGFIHLFERCGYIEGKAERMAHLLVHYPDVCNSQRGPSQSHKAGAWNPLSVSGSGV